RRGRHAHAVPLGRKGREHPPPLLRGLRPPRGAGRPGSQGAPRREAGEQLRDGVGPPERRGAAHARARDVLERGPPRSVRPMTREVRARRRPVATLLVYFWELAWALLVAAPVHAWARRSWGTHPDGDAVLFRPGARE